jgi:hypothetical protein
MYTMHGKYDEFQEFEDNDSNISIFQFILLREKLTFSGTLLT